MFAAEVGEGASRTAGQLDIRSRPRRSSERSCLIPRQIVGFSDGYIRFAPKWVTKGRVNVYVKTVKAIISVQFITFNGDCGL